MNGDVHGWKAAPSTLHSYLAPGDPKSITAVSPVTTGVAPGLTGVSGNGPRTVQVCSAGEASTAP